MSINLQSACQTGAAKLREEFFHIGGHRCLEGHRLLFHRVVEPEAPRMERLTRERNRPKLIRSERVANLSDQRVTAKACLDTYLIALASLQAYFNEARGFE